MPVSFTAIRIYSKLRPNNPTNFALINIGEPIRIELDIEVSTYAITSTSQQSIFNYTNGVIGDGWVYHQGAGFKDFNVGDEIEYKNYTTNGFGGTPVYTPPITVIAKASDFLIQIDVDLFPGQTDQYDSQAIWNVKTPITGLLYKWNFIENNEAENYFSKVDGSLHRAEAPAVDATDTVTIVDMNFLGPKPYQRGGVIVVGDGINTNGVYGFKFKIIHETIFTPFFLSAQWDDVVAKIAPGYFQNGNCLKSIFEITGFFNYLDPNRTTTGKLIDLEGDTGWYGENFNTGVTNYYIDSVVFKKPSLAVIPAIAFSTVETTVEIVVKNDADTPFSNNNTNFILIFNKAPLNESEYQGNLKTLTENFLYDYAFNTVGSAPVDGVNFGTAYQVLKTVEATFISISEIKITAQIAMDASILPDLFLLDEARYVLSAAIQNHLHDAPPPTLVDAVMLQVDAQDFYEDLTDPGMIVFATKFLRHFENDPVTEGVSSIDAFKEDDLVAITQITVDHTGRTSNIIQLADITVAIKAINSVTLEEIILDKWQLNLSQYPLIGGDSYMNVTFPRALHVPAGEIRKNILLKRTQPLDTGLMHTYLLEFPFLINWAYFLQLASASYDFFDPTEPNNGLNNDWFRMQSFTNWSINYTVHIKAKKDAIPLVFNHVKPIIIYDYEDKFADFQLVDTKSYDPDTLTELYDPIADEKYILGYKNTLIKALFSNTVNYPIAISDVHFRIWIEVYEDQSAGPTGSRRISSVWVLDSDTWFLSTDGSGKIVKTLFTDLNSDDQIEASMYVDFTKIPLNKKEFKIMARLYDGLSAFSIARVTESGDLRLTEDSDTRTLEA